MISNIADDPIGAAAHEVGVRHSLTGLTVKPAPLPAWQALPAAKDWLDRALLAASVAAPQNSSAAEWLLDNDFHVQRAILQVKEDLPPRFYDRLPGVADDGTAGLPRIYFLAHELLHATHLQISLNSAIHFIERYQDECPLSIAELWAFPTMLRLACMELLVTGFTRLFDNVPSPFKVGPGTRISGTADDTECVSRAIANLVVISTIQWKDFFDRTSRVEAILQLDPAGVYPRMDFETRDRYRGRIEWMADHCALAERDVAERLLGHCQAHSELPRDHVGYWLIGPGQPEFERAIDVRPPTSEGIRRRLRRHPRAIFVLSLCLVGLAGLTLPLLYLATLGATLLYWLLAIALLALPASLLSVAVINWLVTLTVPPQTLPKLDFAKAIARDCPTAVVMPVLVGQIGEVSELLQRLEGHYLANRDPVLRFVLLSDHADADGEVLPDDHLLEQALIDGVNHLNDRHGTAENRPFHLLHRRRLYNPAQGTWMCWERKRGKLEQFNGLALRGDLSPFPVLAGQVENLRGLRFVVTADADTRLPPGVVSRMIGALAHPLNKARFEPGTGKVLGGYTILQPRVEIYPETMRRSLFTRFFGGDTTIDIYSRAVSDVYQDMTGTGVFVGKGIYELESFERSLEGRIPENSLLSHDLFEGLHGRAGLASDIIVYEGFPSGYLDYARRWHRWVRGDWQLLPWLFPTVPGRGGKHLHNRLSWFDRLKIFDNLRRSLIPASLLALLLSGWFILPGSPLVWTLLAAAVTAVHLFTDVVTSLVRNRHSGMLRELIHRLSDHFGRWMLAMIFLVNDVWVAATAIVITLWRLAAGRKLLEWTSAAHVSAQFAFLNPRRAAWRHMWVSPTVAIAAGLVLALMRPGVLPVAAPLLLLWLIAPEVAIRINRPLGIPAERLNPKDRRFLRGIARRTWLFFETFVRPEDNWLPPDNYQEPPDEAIAHRTSPTNVGMLLLSMLTAWKLGYIGAAELEMRLRQTLDTLDRLEKHRGHMLNWYDTRTLEPLEPRYVSTVDSGNLAVSLVVVQQACLEAARGSAVTAQLWEGLTDALDQLARALEINGLDPERKCSALVAAMSEQVSSGKRDIGGWSAMLDQMHGHDVPGLRERLHHLLTQGENISAALLRDVQVWTERVDHHLLTMRRDLDRFLPWLRLVAQPPAGCADRAAALGQTLGSVADSPALDLESALRHARELLDAGKGAPADNETSQWESDVLSALDHSAEAHRQLQQHLEAIAERAGAWAHGMEFGMLFDDSSRLFHIGYNASANRIDTHHYDLLASEARLASFFAISKGDVPPEHWFFLGRPITKGASGLSLVSWNGSMFEYLMPNLFLRSDPETLLGQSDRTAVDLQRAYAHAHKIPWGISESAYASMGAARVYDYHAFGVPELGLRRGLGRDRVVAPYATSLALAARPKLALRNLRDMAALGLIGRYGFYEAADFTPGRVPEGQRFIPVRSYMAHHHGMSLAALGNALCDDMFVDWFHADAHVRTIDLLLNERIPWVLPPKIERVEAREALPAIAGAIPRLHPWLPAPSGGPTPMHVIGNGRMTAYLATNGGGQLSWHHHTLIGAAAAPGCSGLWIYVRDCASGELWSVTPEPTRTAGSNMHARFHAHQVEFHRRDNDIAINMTVGIPHGDDLEIRRIAIVNEGNQARTLDLTSYGEVILAPGNDAARHPVFSKMFVNSELLPGIHGLLFTRRPRGPEERPPVLLHRLIADDEGIVWRGAEADRAAFLGRHGHADRPAAMQDRDLGDSAGWTLDPIMALRGEIELPPHGRREIAFVTIAAGSRESALEIADRYATLAALEWAMNDAAAPTAREMHQIGLLPGQLSDAQMLLSRLLQPCTTGHADRDVFPAGHFGRHDLWAIGISGDYPLLLMRMDEAQQIELLRFVLTAQHHWRRQGVMIDLIVMHSGTAGYLEPVRDRLLDLLREVGVQDAIGQNGGIHVLGIGPTDGDRAQFMTHVARVVLDETGGSLTDQLARHDLPRAQSPRFEPLSDGEKPGPRTPDLPRPDNLAFDNGLGGFTQEGDYLIYLDPGMTTPAPWSNVLANAGFGTIVTEAGLGFSWSINSGENRLTPWSNDPVEDPQTEILYLRDEENAHLWTPTPQPAGGDSACRIRHGIGHTVWERASEGLEQELLAFVPIDDPVKIVRLRLRNLLPKARRITATYYVEWLLGAVHGEPAPLRTAEYDPAAHAVLAQNPWNEEFRERTAFLTCDLPPHSLTTSRSDFLGRENDARWPEGLLNWDLGGRTQASGADCCAAFQVHLDIPPGETREVVFVLGQADSRAHAHVLAHRWQDRTVVEGAFQACRDHWDTRLGTVQVHTPDPAFDLMVNRWLPYQATSSRIRARAGFYQAGGAFGYRDQLQDVLALLHAAPDEARRHILVAAAHQFEEGDVLHWWHPPFDRGVRTRCSDDMLWLPYVTASYVAATGDVGILQEEQPFLRGAQLGVDEDDRYARFELTDHRASLFNHCERALDRGYRLGAHGLPLIGTGDWNDGMNRVGDRGRGESIWLAWFLIATIKGFNDLCARMDRPELAEIWNARAVELARAVEQAGWDGEWYIRAFDDDGRPWGSSFETECRIDSLAQSWAVLSGAGDPKRAESAIAAARQHLMRDDDRLIRLLTPPFDKTLRDPGYIKSYPPGIRENGGQYTHAATWLAIALAERGDGNGAMELFRRINPINQALTPQDVRRYRIEPYVVAADVAGTAPHIGRGGWSWYTGAGTWTWRLAVEHILGLKLVEGELHIRPCLPADWPSFEVTLTRSTGSLQIRVDNPDGLQTGEAHVTVDGQLWYEATIPFPTNGLTSKVMVLLVRS